MPSLLAPIYFVFATGVDADASGYAEPDAYWAFEELIGDVSAIIGTGDDGEAGVPSLLNSLSARLRWADEELWQDLVS